MGFLADLSLCPRQPPDNSCPRPPSVPGTIDVCAHAHVIESWIGGCESSSGFRLVQILHSLASLVNGLARGSASCVVDGSMSMHDLHGSCQGKPSLTTNRNTSGRLALHNGWVVARRDKIFGRYSLANLAPLTWMGLLRAYLSLHHE